MPLDAWAETDERFRFDRMALQEASIGGGWVTFSGKQCTEYGIATTAARMAHIVLHDEKAIMPASAELCGEYGETGLFAGVPCVLGANGVEQVIELIQNWIAEHPGAVPNVVFAVPRMHADAFREAFGTPEPERPAPVVVAEDEGDREGDDEDWRNVELPEGITLR